MGPLPVVPAQKRFFLVATSYSTKWVEVEAYAIVKIHMLRISYEKHYLSLWGSLKPSPQILEHNSKAERSIIFVMNI